MRRLIQLVVIIGVVFVLMSLTGTLRESGMPFVRALFSQPRGWLLIGVVVAWALVHPLTSFTKESVRMAMDRERLLNAMASLDYKIESEEHDRMTFRARSVARRLMWNFDDRVTVRQDGGFVDIEGLKRIVPRIILRLKVE